MTNGHVLHVRARINVWLGAFASLHHHCNWKYGRATKLQQSSRCSSQAAISSVALLPMLLAPATNPPSNPYPSFSLTHAGWKIECLSRADSLAKVLLDSSGLDDLHLSCISQNCLGA